MMRSSITLCAAMAVAWACAEPAPLPTATELRPAPNPITPLDPLWSKQPHRDRPRAICALPDGSKAYVMLSGIEDDAGTQVAVVDLVARKTLRRLSFPRSPWACALSPEGRWLVVTLRYSDMASVVDTQTDQEVLRVPVPFYTETAIWRPDGKRVYFANRWKDSVLWWDVTAGTTFALQGTNYAGLAPEAPMGTPTSDNPGPLAMTADSKRLFVGSVAGGTIAVLDGYTGKLVDADGDPKTTTVGAPKGISHIDLKSPVGGLAVWKDRLFVADMGRGLGAQPTTGIDIDEDGHPGDGTANLSFQDQQNEIGVIDTATLKEAFRYTSDTICCGDFRDADPDHPDKGLALPLADQWSPDVVQSLPPKSTWLVAGALPEALLVRGDSLWVAFAGTSDIQGFDIGAGGALKPRQAAGDLYKTGYNPKALALGPGGKLVSVNRLGESLTIVDTDQPPGKAETTFVIGDVAGGAFPATDAEMGEAINEMTAPFTIDGDQTCVQCHRDNGAIARPFVMPLQSSQAWSLRNVMAQRGLYDTRPWFFETAMDETNFFPVLNEFARRENFCCEQLNKIVWANYPSVTECQKDPAKKGCNHVMNCTADPPPECAAQPYAKTPYLKRSDFIRAAAKQLFGRDTAIGDVLVKEDLQGNSKPLVLDFEGITRALGLFMLRTPRLLPNPNAHLNLPTARRGKDIYLGTDAGCNSCHPLPVTTTATLPSPFSPFNMPFRFPPVISPERRPDGTDAMAVTEQFIATFPQVVQTPAGLHVGSTPLRGLWDRPQSRFFHDGRGRSLVSSLATPHHPALKPGELGHNVRDGVRDTHGGTSQLDKWALQDLANFLLTL